MSRIPIACNILLTFRSASFKDGYGRAGKKWTALELLFEYMGHYHKEKIFGAYTNEERIKNNQLLRHISNVIGIEYDLIEYQNSFEEFCKLYVRESQPFWGCQVYAKLVPRVDAKEEKVYPRFGYDFPILSLNPDLSYSPDELAAIESADMKAQNFESYEPIKEQNLGDEVPF